MNSGLEWSMEATSSHKEDCNENSEFHKDACCLNEWRVELVRGESLKGPFSKFYLISYYL